MSDGSSEFDWFGRSGINTAAAQAIPGLINERLRDPHYFGSVEGLVAEIAQLAVPRSNGTTDVSWQINRCISYDRGVVEAFVLRQITPDGTYVGYLWQTSEQARRVLIPTETCRPIFLPDVDYDATQALYELLRQSQVHHPVDYS